MVFSCLKHSDSVFIYKMITICHPIKLYIPKLYNIHPQALFIYKWKFALLNSHALLPSPTVSFPSNHQFVICISELLHSFSSYLLGFGEEVGCNFHVCFSLGLGVFFSGFLCVFFFGIYPTRYSLSFLVPWFGI